MRFAKWFVVVRRGFGPGLVLAGCAAVGLVLFLWMGTPRATSGGIKMSWPPHDPSNAVRLLVLGDTGTGGAGQFQVAGAMERACNQAKKQPFDGILMLGDNFYPAGVSSTVDPQWQEKFEKPYGSPCLSGLPVYPVLGNHDYRLSPEAQIEYSAVQDRWRMPGRFYSVDFGPLVRLVALDTNRFDWCGSARDCVYDFLKSRLGSAKGAWTIVTGHHPMASSSSHGVAYDGTYFKYTVRPEICEHADFYLSGHAHQLEHLSFSGCKTDFVVAGTGGAEVGRLKSERPGSKFVQSTFGFVAMELTAEKATLIFYDVDLRELYRIERVRE